MYKSVPVFGRETGQKPLERNPRWHQSANTGCHMCPAKGPGPLLDVFEGNSCNLEVPPVSQKAQAAWDPRVGGIVLCNRSFIFQMLPILTSKNEKLRTSVQRRNDEVNHYPWMLASASSTLQYIDLHPFSYIYIKAYQSTSTRISYRLPWLYICTIKCIKLDSYVMKCSVACQFANRTNRSFVRLPQFSPNCINILLTSF